MPLSQGYETNNKDQMWSQWQSSYLNTDCQVVLLDPLVVQRMVDLHVRPGPAVLLPLLEVERVVLVGLVRGAANQPVKHGRVVFDAGASRVKFALEQALAVRKH